MVGRRYAHVSARPNTVEPRMEWDGGCFHPQMAQIAAENTGTPSPICIISVICGSFSAAVFLHISAPPRFIPPPSILCLGGQWRPARSGLHKSAGVTAARWDGAGGVGGLRRGFAGSVTA